MRPRITTLLGLLGASLVAAGCGSGDDAASGRPAPHPEAEARPADFPSARGRTLADLRAEAREALVFAPSVQDLRRGTNRFGFALFDVAQKQVAGAQVALYTAREDGDGLRGPYPARAESLAVKGAYRSLTTANDPDSAKSVYVTDVQFRRTGKQLVTALARLDGRLVASSLFTVEVRGDGDGPPEVGERAVRVHTQTLEDVAGDADALSTRRPPARDLLRTDLADVVGRRPVVITFATPLLCASRVCGPVVDIVEEVRASAPRGVAFIHQEVYRDNQVDKGLCPQIVAWRLRSEPWTFVIDRRGRVRERFEGAFSVAELKRAVARVT